MSLSNTLTVHAIKALSLNGCHVWRQNNGGVFDPTKKVFRRNSSTPGISDIIGFHKRTGIFIAVEIKAGKDKLRPDQERFLADVKKAGGFTMVVKTMDDVELIYKSGLKLKP